MELYYIAPLDTWKDSLNLFAESHWIFTDDPTLILVCAQFRHKADEQFWRSQPGVEPLPHPQEFDPKKQKISPRHADLLKSLGVDLTYRTIEVAEKAAARHPLMKWIGI